MSLGAWPFLPASLSPDYDSALTYSSDTKPLRCDSTPTLALALATQGPQLNGASLPPRLHAQRHLIDSTLNSLLNAPLGPVGMLGYPSIYRTQGKGNSRTKCGVNAKPDSSWPILPTFLLHFDHINMAHWESSYFRIPGKVGPNSFSLNIFETSCQFLYSRTSC